MATCILLTCISYLVSTLSFVVLFVYHDSIGQFRKGNAFNILLEVILYDCLGVLNLLFILPVWL